MNPMGRDDEIINDNNGILPLVEDTFTLSEDDNDMNEGQDEDDVDDEDEDEEDFQWIRMPQGNNQLMLAIMRSMQRTNIRVEEPIRPEFGDGDGTMVTPMHDLGGVRLADGFEVNTDLIENGSGDGPLRSAIDNMLRWRPH